MPARPGESACLGHGGIGIEVFAGRIGRYEATGLGALFAQDAGQLARVDVGEAEHVRGPQVGIERMFAAKIRGQQRQVADHQTGRMDERGFAILAVDTVVADMGVGQGDDLPGVGRIGQDFLVAGHRGVENHFADAAAGGANAFASKHRSVGQGK
jgi:hypothetical protein